MIAFHERLKKMRIDRKWTQAEAAEKIGISASSYRNYEKGLFFPTYPALQKMAAAFGVDYNGLIGGYPSVLEVREKLENIIDALKDIQELEVLLNDRKTEIEKRIKGVKR